jgi:hypothetical protein
LLGDLVIRIPSQDAARGIALSPTLRFCLDGPSVSRKQIIMEGIPFLFLLDEVGEDLLLGPLGVVSFLEEE